MQGHEDRKIVPIFFGSLHHNGLLKCDVVIVYGFDDKIPIIGGVREIYFLGTRLASVCLVDDENAH